MDSKPHVCYILESVNYNRAYIGYTVNFPRRIRQHNGDIVGGAKRTIKYRPWSTFCIISGFEDNHTALRFEYRLQHPHRRKKKGQQSVNFVLNNLSTLINQMDGSVSRNDKRPWPLLTITWFDPENKIVHPNVINRYDVL